MLHGCFGRMPGRQIPGAAHLKFQGGRSGYAQSAAGMHRSR